jgi:aspartate racemase
MSENTIKTIGILGGMGPEATVFFYQKILSLTPAAKDQDHIPTLIYSNPHIPDRSQAILSREDDSIIFQLQQSTQILKQGGAAFVVIPCNNAHYWIPQIREAVDIPIMDMIEETLKHLEKKGISQVGLLATEGTLKSQIYPMKSKDRLEIIVPPDTLSQEVMSTIRQIKAGSRAKSLYEPIDQARAWFQRQGIDKIILGCTELPLLYTDARDIEWFVDPMDLLAQRAIAVATGKETP